MTMWDKWKETPSSGRLLRLSSTFLCLLLQACGTGSDEISDAVATTLEEQGYLRVDSRVNCVKAISTNVYSYYSVKYTDGSRDVTCTVMDPYGTYTSTAYYAGTSQGALTGYCQLVYDMEWDGTFGKFTVEIVGSSVVGTYQDVSSVYNGTTVTFDSSSCPVLDL